MKKAAGINPLKTVMHVIILLILVGALLGLLTWSGVIRCSVIPGWCDVYWGVMNFFTGGEPKVAIVTGNDGLGEPELLQRVMQDPRHGLGKRVELLYLDRVGLGNLKKYDLIIVEKARTMKTSQLKMFVDYVIQGGRLVWTGDAGAKLAEGDEPLYWDERTPGKEHVEIGPWARKDGNKMLNFDEFLSVNYITNFCEATKCKDENVWVGTFYVEPGADHPLVKGLSPTLPMYGDFAIVEQGEGVNTTRVLSVDTLANIYSKDRRDLGKNFPVIVTSGMGERIAYYAVPPEQFTKYDYYSFIENLYYGMLK